jgi:transposase
MSVDVDVEDLARRLVVGRKRDGRAIYDPMAKGELIRACLSPGVSVTRLARDCGVNANQLSTWVRERQRLECATSGQHNVVVDAALPAFVPVLVQQQATQEEPVMRLALHARLPNGVTLDLREIELRHVGEVVDALGRMRCSVSTKG